MYVECENMWTQFLKIGIKTQKNALFVQFDQTPEITQNQKALQCLQFEQGGRNEIMQTA